MSDIFSEPGLRTPFVRASGVFAQYSALDLSKPIAAATGAKARPDFVVWSRVIPDPLVSNIARELVFEAGLDPEIPAFSAILACFSSFAGAVSAAGMIGHGDAHLALVGGVEAMSHAPFALLRAKADSMATLFVKVPAAAAAAFAELNVADSSLPVRGRVNKQTGRSQGEHTEDTARFSNISRQDQDELALRSHRGAVAGQDAGFFADPILPFGGIDHDTLPDRDTSLEMLAKLPSAFEATSGMGSRTAGNSSPLTDGAASLRVRDAEGLSDAPWPDPNASAGHRGKERSNRYTGEQPAARGPSAAQPALTGRCRPSSLGGSDRSLFDPDRVIDWRRIPARLNLLDLGTLEARSAKPPFCNAEVDGSK